MSADLCLVAVGRGPITDGLGLDEAGVTLERGYVKVDVRLHSQERMTVQLARAEADVLALTVGDKVRIEMGDAKVFVGDYVI